MARKSALRGRHCAALAWVLLLPAVGALGQGEQAAGVERGPDAADGFLRLATDGQGAMVALQTAIVSFRSGAPRAEGLQVDLVSAVHIGDQRYYEELNARFREYDAVLYELVAPAGSVPAGGGRHGGIVSGTQLAMTRLLELAFQLDAIDYTPANFVHADLSPQEVSRSMADRGESLSQYLVKLFAVAMTEQAKDPYGLRDMGLLTALFSSDRARLLKKQFAAAMLDMDTFTTILEGEDGSTLVGERNRRAISVLDDRIALGDTRIAIFYGAAHMSDMAARLESDVGLERDGTVWLDAWDLR